MDNNKLSYDELKTRCNELQLQVIRHLKIEQDLVQTKNQLDRDLIRFQSINTYTQKAIQAVSLEEFAEITVESVIETFEVECSAFFKYDNKKNSLNIEAFFGFEDEVKTVCTLDQEWIASRGFNKDGKILIEQVQPDSVPMGDLGLSQVILSPYYDEDGNLHGMLAGGISLNKKDYYDEISEELIPSFKVFTQQMSSLLQNFEAKQYLDMKVQQRTAEVVKQKEEIEKQKLEITESIQYASRIQNALLPPDEEMDKLLPSYFILNKPREIVSGDYYWISQKNNKVIVAVADCTGHGVPGAFMSILGIASLNEIVNKTETIVANEILNQLREQLIKSLRQTGRENETRDGIEISLCVIDFDSKKLQYSGAIRPLYYIRDKEISEIKGDYMPIGVLEGEKHSFNIKEMEFQENDLIYLFSDGFVDQIGGPERKTFRSKYFKELLVDIHEESLDKQKDVLEKTYEEWKGDMDQIDDILIMGIQFSKGGPQ